MRSVLLGVMLAFTLPAAAQDQAVKDLEGTYTVKEFERGGKPVPDEVKKGVSPVRIASGKLTLTAGGKSLTAVLKADPVKKPATIDLYPQGKEYEEGKKFLGLYQADGNELTLLFVEEGERPKEFKSEAKTATKLVLVKK
jgi:uncharacterized protein (TIGR03067 family)